MSMKADFSFFLARDLGVQWLKETLGDGYESDALDGSKHLEELALHSVYASNLPFHDVEDSDDGLAIPRVFGTEKPERDEPFGFLVPTDRQFRSFSIVSNSILTREELFRKFH